MYDNEKHGGGRGDISPEAIPYEEDRNALTLDSLRDVRSSHILPSVSNFNHYKSNNGKPMFSGWPIRKMCSDQEGACEEDKCTCK